LLVKNCGEHRFIGDAWEEMTCASAKLQVLGKKGQN